MRFRLFDTVEQSLISLVVGRYTLNLFLWVMPAVERGSWGYDCLWRTWAVYPLFELEEAEPAIFED